MFEAETIHHHQPLEEEAEAMDAIAALLKTIGTVEKPDTISDISDTSSDTEEELTLLSPDDFDTMCSEFSESDFYTLCREIQKSEKLQTLEEEIEKPVINIEIFGDDKMDCSETNILSTISPADTTTCAITTVKRETTRDVTETMPSSYSNAKCTVTSTTTNSTSIPIRRVSPKTMKDFVESDSESLWSSDEDDQEDFPKSIDDKYSSIDFDSEGDEYEYEDEEDNGLEKITIDITNDDSDIKVTERHLDELKLNGFTVIENVMTKEDCLEATEELADFVQYSTKTNEQSEDFDTTKNDDGIAWHSTVRECRLKCLPIFKEILNTDKLVSSIDGISFASDIESTSAKTSTWRRPSIPDVKKVGHRLHYKIVEKSTKEQQNYNENYVQNDELKRNFAVNRSKQFGYKSTLQWYMEQDKARKGVHAYQGILSLKETGSGLCGDKWGTKILSGSHLCHVDRPEGPNSNNSCEFMPIRKTDVQTGYLSGCKEIEPRVPAGGLLLIDSRTVRKDSPPVLHFDKATIDNGKVVYEKETCGRCNIKVSMVPACWLSNSDVSKRRSVLYAKSATNHFCHGVSKRSSTMPISARAKTDICVSNLSTLERLLYSVDMYEKNDDLNECIPMPKIDESLSLRRKVLQKATKERSRVKRLRKINGITGPITKSTHRTHSVYNTSYSMDDVYLFRNMLQNNAHKYGHLFGENTNAFY